MAVGRQRQDAGRFTPGEEPRYTLQKVQRAPESVWRGFGKEKISCPTTGQNPDRPARSEPLYRHLLTKVYFSNS